MCRGANGAQVCDPRQPPVGDGGGLGLGRGPQTDRGSVTRSNLRSGMATVSGLAAGFPTSLRLGEPRSDALGADQHAAKRRAASQSTTLARDRRPRERQTTCLDIRRRCKRDETRSTMPCPRDRLRYKKKAALHSQGGHTESGNNQERRRRMSSANPPMMPSATVEGSGTIATS